MKLRIASVLLISLFIIGCGSSQSVYQLPDSQQKGLTYQTYQEAPSEVFDTVSEVLKNVNEKRLMQKSWEIESADKNSGNIETKWKKIGGSGSDSSDSDDGSEETAGQPEMDGTGSVSGGRVMGSGSDERYKLNVEITEAGSGSKVSLKLKKQVKMSQWRTFKVKKKTAKNHLQPLINELNSVLTMQ